VIDHLKQLAFAAAAALHFASPVQAETDSLFSAMKICSANLGNDMALEKAFRKDGWDRQPFNSPLLIVFTKDAERSLVAFPRAYRKKNSCFISGKGATERELAGLVARLLEVSPGKFRPVPNKPGLWIGRVGGRELGIGVDRTPRRLYFFQAPVLYILAE